MSGSLEAKSRQDGLRPGASLWSYRGLIWNFGKRDLKARYKGTVLGWLWTLVVPLATLLVYSVVFSTIMRNGAPEMGSGNGNNFTLWLWAGLAPWNLFATGLNTAIGSMLATGQLMKKIYFPAYVPVFGSLIATGLQTFIELGLLLVILAVVGNLGLTWLLVPAWLALWVIFVAGICVALSILNVYFRDVTHLVSIALQLLFYATPIIYPPSLLANLPDHWYTPVIDWAINLNPMAHFIGGFRSLIWDLSWNTLGEWGIMVGLAGLSVLLAVWAYRRYGRDLVEEL